MSEDEGFCAPRPAALLFKKTIFFLCSELTWIGCKASQSYFAVCLKSTSTRLHSNHYKNTCASVLNPMLVRSMDHRQVMQV